MSFTILFKKMAGVACILGLACLGSAAQAKQIAVSLNALAQTAKSSLGQGNPLPMEARNLCGIDQMNGYLVDAEHQDIVLLGRAAEQRPALHYDDLVLMLRSQALNHQFPYCSLDPYPRNILALNKVLAQTPDLSNDHSVRRYGEQLKKTVGGMQVVVGGVPKQSSISHAMIYSDYIMKQLSLGLRSDSEMPSMMDRTRLNSEDNEQSGAQGASSSGKLARFWFHIDQGDPKFITSPSADIVNLASAKVVLLTERQMTTADGHLVDAGDDDPQLQTYADLHTAHFQQLARQYPEYASLENLYRLLALIHAMTVKNALSAANLDVEYLLRRSPLLELKPMPVDLQGLVNYDLSKTETDTGRSKLQRFSFSVAAGGVSMETPLSPRNFELGDPKRLSFEKLAVMRQKPKPAAVCWVVD